MPFIPKSTVFVTLVGRASGGGGAGSSAPSGPAISCAISSPASGASVTQATPVTITGTVSQSATVAVKLGSTVLGSATMAGLGWSFSWTPQPLDIGAQTLNATATATADGTTADAAGVPVTVLFSGNFASLFASSSIRGGALQADRGLTLGTTPKAAGTTPPVGTLSGAFSGTPVPLLFKCTNAAAIGSGATFSAFADGTGTTPFQTGITPVVGTPVALTGVGAGVSMAWAAGTAALDNTWTSTAGTMTDQGAAGVNNLQAVATKQPTVTVGSNGHVGLLYDGVDDFHAAAVNYEAPGTVPTYMFKVYKVPTGAWAANLELFSCQAFANGIQLKLANPTPGVNATAGTPSASNGSLALNTFGCVEAHFSNSAADFLHVGTDTDHTGVSFGNTTGNGRWIAQGESSQFLKMELLVSIDLNALPSPALRAIARACVTSYYGAGVNV